MAETSRVYRALMACPDALLAMFGGLAHRLHHALDGRHVAECEDLVQRVGDVGDPKTVVKGLYRHLWHMPRDHSRFVHDSDEAWKARLDGWDEAEAQLAKLPTDKGVVFIAAHLGPWELVAQTIARFYRDMVCVYKPAKQTWVNDFFHALRHRPNHHTVPKDGGLLPLLRQLKQKGAVGLVIDQHGGKEGIPSSFLGQPCSSWDSSVLLAHRSKCPIVPVGMIRKGSRYRFLIADPIWTGDDKKPDVSTLVKRCDEALSNFIRQAPEQWLWLGRRWGRDYHTQMQTEA